MKISFWHKIVKKPHPVISIIIPTYNAERTLEATISSVLWQSYEKIELLLIDGLSSDQTVSIIKSAAIMDSRVKYISEKDEGAYDAMNKGIEMSKGDWVYFLGADDLLIHNDIFQELLEEGYFFQKKVFYGNVIIDGETAWAKDGEIYAGEFDLSGFLKKNICHQAIFYTRKFIERAGFFNTKYLVCADWDYNLRLWALHPFLYVDKIIARFHGGGLSSITNDIVFGKEISANIIRYFNLDPDDPKLIAPGSPFKSVIMTYRRSV